MKSKVFLFVVLLSMTSFIIAQNKQGFKSRFEDAIEENEHNNLTLRFYNAITGNPIVNASVTITGQETRLTDADGKILFPAPPEDGFIEVTFEADGYISGKFNEEIIAGTIFFNRYSVSPILDVNKIRIILDWEQEPGDLDSHFVKENTYHISFRNTRVLADGTGMLDRDDMDGFGPETITVEKADQNSVYGYFVHDFTNREKTNSNGLSDSKACVKLYGNGQLLQVFRIPQGATGNLWEVFHIENGQIIPVNQVTNASN